MATSVRANCKRNGYYLAANILNTTFTFFTVERERVSYWLSNVSVVNGSALETIYSPSFAVNPDI